MEEFVVELNSTTPFSRCILPVFKWERHTHFFFNESIIQCQKLLLKFIKEVNFLQ